MTTDRDLLARAAQAAGKSRAEWDYDWLVERGVDVSRDMLWNPLANSGEALELAVLRKLTVAVRPHEVEVFDDDGDCLSSLSIAGSIDPLAATRRAITRAAAETAAA